MRFRWPLVGSKHRAFADRLIRPPREGLRRHAFAPQSMIQSATRKVARHTPTSARRHAWEFTEQIRESVAPTSWMRRRAMVPRAANGCPVGAGNASMDRTRISRAILSDSMCRTSSETTGASLGSVSGFKRSNYNSDFGLEWMRQNSCGCTHALYGKCRS